jgi:hypothetical protein
MKCRECQDFFRALADGETVAAEISTHLGACANCRQAYARYSALVSALRELPHFEDSHPQSLKIHRGVHAAVDTARRRRFWTLGLAAPALGAVVLGSILLVSPYEQPNPGWNAARIDRDAGKEMDKISIQPASPKQIAAPSTVTDAAMIYAGKPTTAAAFTGELAD